MPENKNDSTPSSFAVELLHRIWTTKGARFNAHRRFRTQGQLSIHTISWLSAYVFVATLATIYPGLNLSEAHSHLITFITSALAVLILVLSVLEGGKEYALKSERLHQCAIQLSGLYDEIKQWVENSTSLDTDHVFLAEAAKKYEDILMRTSENHETIDYDYFLSQYPKEFGISHVQTIWIKFLWFLKVYGFHRLLVWSPPILIVIYIL